MSNRRILIAELAVAVALQAVVPAAQAVREESSGAIGSRATSPLRCASSGRTVVSTSQVRVFRKSNHVYACRLPKGKPRAIAATLDQIGGPGGFHIAGARVGFSTMYCGKSSCTTKVQMVDTGAGRWTMLPQPTETRGIPGIVLTADGALAWIRMHIAAGTTQQTFEVVLRDRAGERVAASGSDVDGDSLALAGRRVYWTQAGQAASALLG